MFHRRNSGIYVSSLLESVPWLEHGFASRHADGWPGEYVKVRQLHSAIVHVHQEPGRTTRPAGNPPQGDALVTRNPGRWIGVRTADCVPVLLADTDKQAVAAIHAGWRGTLTDIAGETLKTMKEVYGTERGHVVAAIGPCISECCFEVGPEVAGQFEPLFHFETVPSHINLAEANLRQLLAAGISAEHIDVADLCTVCNDREFHSYRRDREASGRMVSAIRIAKRN